MKQAFCPVYLNTVMSALQDIVKGASIACRFVRHGGAYSVLLCDYCLYNSGD